MLQWHRLKERQEFRIFIRYGEVYKRFLIEKALCVGAGVILGELFVIERFPV